MRAADHPATIQSPGDFDFSGSPVVFTAPGCAETVAATNKNGRLFLWHSAAIEQGPYVDVRGAADDAGATAAHADGLRREDALALRAHRLCARAGRRRRLQDGARRLAGAHARRDPARLADGRRLDRVDHAREARRRRSAATTRRRGGCASRRPPAVLAFVPPAIVGGRVFAGAQHAFAVAKPRPSRAQAAVGRPRRTRAGATRSTAGSPASAASTQRVTGAGRGGRSTGHRRSACLR